MKGKWSGSELKKMKIKRFQKVNPDKNALQLKLYTGDQGATVLKVVNEVGEDIFCGNLITFYPDGTIALNMCINKDLPFSMNDRRQLTFPKY